MGAVTCLIQMKKYLKILFDEPAAKGLLDSLNPYPANVENVVSS
jgi:hypothetical protein